MIKSLEKAILVLNCFIDKQPLGVTEISNELGLYKSNVYNILNTFKEMGYLSQDMETGKYSLGINIFSLSRALIDNMTVTKIVSPMLQKISDEANEVVYLAIPKDDELVYVDVAYPTSNKVLGGGPVTGERAKLFCTGAGKAILSRMPDEEVDKVLSCKREKYTDYTITDEKLLRLEIEKARKNGYALDNMELILGMKCIGVAVMNHKGGVECSLSISAPSLRMQPENIEKHSKILNRYRIEIEKMF